MLNVASPAPIVKSSASLNIVALKSPHVTPKSDADETMTGVRVGVGVGSIVGAGVVGAGDGATVVGEATGLGVGPSVGLGVGPGAGLGVGPGAGLDVDPGAGLGVGPGVRSGMVPSSIGTGVVVGRGVGLAQNPHVASHIPALRQVGQYALLHAFVGFPAQYERTSAHRPVVDGAGVSGRRVGSGGCVTSGVGPATNQSSAPGMNQSSASSGVESSRIGVGTGVGSMSTPMGRTGVGPAVEGSGVGCKALVGVAVEGAGIGADVGVEMGADVGAGTGSAVGSPGMAVGTADRSDSNSIGKQIW